MNSIESTSVPFCDETIHFWMHRIDISTHHRVLRLRVERSNHRVLLYGLAPTFHVLQLAIAACQAMANETSINFVSHIEVGSLDVDSQCREA